MNPSEVAQACEPALRVNLLSRETRTVSYSRAGFYIVCPHGAKTLRGFGWMHLILLHFSHTGDRHEEGCCSRACSSRRKACAAFFCAARGEAAGDEGVSSHAAQRGCRCTVGVLGTKVPHGPTGLFGALTDSVFSCRVLWHK